MITTRYRLLALVGHPVTHSLSPVFQNAALVHLGLPYVYLAFDVPPQHLSVAVAGFRALEVTGFNVTVPHKEVVVPLLDHLAGCASQLRAANTVVNVQGELVGYNTDVAGLQVTLHRIGFIPDEPVALLGAGGAARAVVYALSILGKSPLTVFNRNRSRVESLREWAKSTLKQEIQIDSWESFTRGNSPFLGECRLFINATSLGVRDEQFSVPWKRLTRCRSIVDLAYRPAETLLVREARRQGFTACDGKTMLIGQGAESFYLFTGQQAPLDVMERALERDQ